MPKIIAVAVLVFAVTIGVAACSKQGSSSHSAGPPGYQALSPALIKKLELHATLKDGQISGTFFNPNAGVTVTKISIEAALKGDGSSSTNAMPRIFNVTAVATPQAMSSEFHVAAAGLDPERYALRITGAVAGGSP